MEKLVMQLRISTIIDMYQLHMCFSNSQHSFPYLIVPGELLWQENFILSCIFNSLLWLALPSNYQTLGSGPTQILLHLPQNTWELLAHHSLMSKLQSYCSVASPLLQQSLPEYCLLLDKIFVLQHNIQIHSQPGVSQYLLSLILLFPRSSFQILDRNIFSTLVESCILLIGHSHPLKSTQSPSFWAGLFRLLCRWFLYVPLPQHFEETSWKDPPTGLIPSLFLDGVKSRPKNRNLSPHFFLRSS